MYSLSDLVQPVACARPLGDYIVTDPRLRRFAPSKLRRIQAQEEAYRRSIVERVTAAGYYPRRGERVEAAGEFEAMVKIVAAKFGGKTHRKDACESRSHERGKDRKRGGCGA